MKYFFFFILTTMYSSAGFAQQQEAFGLLSFTIPSGWKKELKENSVVYSKVNNTTRTWVQFGVYKETASKGSVDLDFESEWAQLVQPLGVVDPAQNAGVQEFDGWKMKTGTGSFTFSGSNASTSLTVFSGYNVCLSIITNTNSGDYTQLVDGIFATLQLTQPSNTQPVNTQPENIRQDTPGGQLLGTTAAYKDNFAFTTTNFDDGWVSAVQPDWVEVRKANIKVLLHYPKDGTIFPADPGPLTDAAWNILVAPRYSNLQHYKTTYINTYNRPYIGMGYATDNATQQNVFVVLFRQSAGWLEVIAPDKNTFMQYFQFDPEIIRWDSNTDPLKTLDNMIGRNRFAVAASDLNNTGEWNSHFSSNTFWTNIYTGNSAGMSTYSSSSWFVFGANQSYSWQLIAANSAGGMTNTAQAKGAGSFRSVNNWQLEFDNIEGKKKTYDVYFTAMKGGRVLFMNDARYPGSGVFTGYARK
jgi:hypothetical protein